jgi:FkbM family methyltransferase
MRGYRLTNFYSQFVTEGDLCFDVGTHVGNHLRALLQLGAKVVAVEPQPDIMRLLRFLYGHDKNVILLEVALGERTGVERLHVSSRNPTISSLSPEWVYTVQQTAPLSSAPWDHQITVEVATLNSLIDIYGQPSFCKLDVEGYEENILKSLTIPIQALSFEYLPAARESAIECVRCLGRLANYQFNCTIGESRHFYFDRWVTQEELEIWINNLLPNQRSGDIYAHLV